jgi:predicted AAA+ superfamily ATPase
VATDPAALHHGIVQRLLPDERTYVFVDEVQVVPNFELAVNSLQLRPQVDLYLTGSNAQMLSGDLATRLSGRYVEIHVTPLSLSEFAEAGRLRGQSAPSPARLYAEFTRWGAFPFAVGLAPDRRAVADYLDGLVNTILVKDVMVRQRASNAAMLRDVTAFLLSNVGNQTSARRVANTLAAAGRGPSPNTVEQYLAGLVDAYLLYPAPVIDVAGLRHLDTPKKYYAVDSALRGAMGLRASPDTGHLLENAVFLELLRRHRRVWTGRAGAAGRAGGEIDFVVESAEGRMYIQVAATVRDPQTAARELAPLLAVADHHPKLLLTLDEDPATSHDGVRQLNAVDWLLEQPVPQIAA